MERLQTQTYPIGYNIRRWFCNFFRDMNMMFLEDDSRCGASFQKWSQSGVPAELSDQVKKMGRSFVHKFLTNIRYRIRPYWKLILGMETINPCCPYRLSPAAWDGVRDLCRRVGMTDIYTDSVVMDLKRQIGSTASWSLPEVKACTNNLFRFYHDRLKTDKKHHKNPDFPLANRFA